MGRSVFERLPTAGLFFFGRETHRADVRARDGEGRDSRCAGAAVGSRGFSGGAACDAAAGDFQIVGWAGDSRAIVCAQEFQGGRETRGAALFPWRAAAADAAGLALHVLLLEFVWDEPIPGESRLHRALRELPRRHRVWTRVPRGHESWAEGRKRISGCGGGRKIPGVTRRGGCKTHWIVGWELRRVPDGAGVGAQLRFIRGGRGYAWRARLEGGYLG